MAIMTGGGVGGGGFTGGSVLPQAVNDTASTPANETLTGNVLTNDSFYASLTQFVVNSVTKLAGQTYTDAAKGSITLASNGDLTFIPVSTFTGTFPTVTYTISNPNGTASATLVITVTAPVNHAPTANADTASGNEDTSITGNVLTNDTDIDGNTLTVTQFTVGSTTKTAGQTYTESGKGSIVINSNGSFTLTPVANWNGQFPTVTYTISDGSTTANSTLIITVASVNDAPTTVNDTATRTEESTVTGNVLTNDSDIEGATLTVTQFVVNSTTKTAGQSYTDVTKGTITINSNGSYSFVPLPNWNGTFPTVTYTASDGSATNATKTGTLIITITPVNDIPVAYSDYNEGGLNVTLTGNVLANDIDVDSSMYVTLFIINGIYTGVGNSYTISQVGTFSMASTGSYVFTPNNNWTGTLNVSYQVTDSFGSDIGTLTLVSRIQAPYLTNDMGQGEEDTYANGDVLANDTSSDPNIPVSVLSYQIGSTVYQAGEIASIYGGTFDLVSSGGWTFYPAPNWYGSLSVNYTASNGGLTSSSWLDIYINPANDWPVGVGSTTTTGAVNTTITGNLLTNVTDVDGDLLTIYPTYYTGSTARTTDTTYVLSGIGSFRLNTDGSYVFTPNSGWSGTAPLISYNVSDGSINLSGDLTLIISAPPVANPDTASGNEDEGPICGNVLSNDSDPENDALSVTKVTINGVDYDTTSPATIYIPGTGTLNVYSDGGYCFYPDPNWNGTVPTITYTITDGTSTRTSTLVITVISVNDGPVVGDTTVTGNNTSPTTGNVLTNSSDPEGSLIQVVGFRIFGDITYHNPAVEAIIDAIGRIIIQANGDFTFTPTTNWQGGPVPKITYDVSDGVNINPGDLNIIIPDVNIPPIVTQSGGPVTTYDNITYSNYLTITDDANPNSRVSAYTINGVGTMDVSPGGNVTTVLAGKGSFSLNSQGYYTFTPVFGFTEGMTNMAYTLNMVVTATDEKASSTGVLSIIIKASTNIIGTYSQTDQTDYANQPVHNMEFGNGPFTNLSVSCLNINKTPINIPVPVAVKIIGGGLILSKQNGHSNGTIVLSSAVVTDTKGLGEGFVELNNGEIYIVDLNLVKIKTKLKIINTGSGQSKIYFN